MATNPALAPAVQQPMQGTGISAQAPLISQVSQQAPVSGAKMQPPNPSEMSAPTVPASPQQVPMGNPQDEMIIKALTDRLKFNQKTAEQSLQAPSPSVPMGGGGGYTVPMSAPMGGCGMKNNKGGAITPQYGSQYPTIEPILDFYKKPLY